MFGLPPVPWGPLGVAGGADTRPTNTPEDLAALQAALAAVMAKNRTPNGRVARGFDQFGPQASQPAPAAPAPQMLPPVTVSDEETPNSHVAQGFGALSSRALAPAAPAAPVAPPLPQMAAAPPAPPTPAAQDTWGPSGPIGSPQSVNLGPQQASGPDVIQKLMSYFKNKDNPSAT